MLGDLNPDMERLGGIAGKHRDVALAEDIPGIDSGINKMDSAAGFGNARFQRLTPGFQSAKGGEERGMDIDDPSREGIQERFLDDAHVSGEHDEIDLGLLEKLDKFRFGLWCQLGAEGAWGDEMPRDSKGLCQIKNAGALHIGEHDHWFASENACSMGFGKGAKIGTFTGT